MTGRLTADEWIFVIRAVDWLVFVLSVVTALASIYFGFGSALLLRTLAGASTPALAIASFVLLVLSLAADRRWGKIPENRALRMLGAAGTVTVRISGMNMAVANGFAIVPIALAIHPSLADGGMGRGIDPLWLGMAALVAAAGVLLQVELPRLAWKLGE